MCRQSAVLGRYATNERYRTDRKPEAERMDVEEYPWPVRGEKLFRDDLPDWRNNACLYWHGGWYVYAESYREAAQVLVQEVTERRGLVDLLVYPIVYTYRHYLELSMKHLISSGHALLDEHRDFAESHDLSKLWRDCRDVLARVPPPPSKDDLAAVDEKISELSTLDPGSMSFRYPVGSAKQGRGPLLPDDLRLNVRHFADQMEQLAGLFTGAGEMIAVYQQQKDDLDREYRS